MLVTKLALGAAAVPFAIGGAAGFADKAEAHRGGEQHMPVEIREAIEANDYEAWYTAVTANEKSPLAAHADEEVFTAVQDIHSLMEAGDKEGAHQMREQLAESLGIEFKHKGRRAHKFAKRGERGAYLSEEARAALHEAKAEGDYEAWLEVAEEYLPEELVANMTEKRFENMGSRSHKRAGR